MWWTNALQYILELITQNSEVIAGLLLSVIGWRVGLIGWLAKKILTKVIEWLGREANDQVTKIEDNQTIKEGEELQKLPATPDVIQKRKKNFLDLIRGKK